MSHVRLWRRNKHLQPFGRSHANSSQRHTLNGSPRRDPHKDRVSALKKKRMDTVAPRDQEGLLEGARR
jgi:hypothetical protein